jgi:putative transposase
MTNLLTFINFQEQIFRTLLTLLIGKSMFDKSTEQPVNKPYRKLQVDDLLIIKVPEKLDYQILIT